MKSHRSGITLIEVLIAVSLLSLLALGALIAMRIGFNTMDKTDAHLEQNRRVANARKIIENEIAGFLYTTAEWRPQPLEIQVIPFQQWEGQSMRFVTSYSLQDAWRGRPQIAALQVIPGDEGQGVRLIVNEIPYTGAAQAGEQVSGSSPIQIPEFRSPCFAPVARRARPLLCSRTVWRTAVFLILNRASEPPYACLAAGLDPCAAPAAWGPHGNGAAWNRQSGIQCRGTPRHNCLHATVRKSRVVDEVCRCFLARPRPHRRRAARDPRC